MAIQNFISGGYYGKLGETVGQRWKNKRTIRKYVVPKNPRTEKQQANRGQFGSAVPWAHIGMDMNFRNKVWDSSNTIEWNQRMSVVLNRIKQGKQGMELIPLTPENFVSPFFISELTINDSSTQEKWILDCKGQLPDENRNLMLCIELWDETGMVLRNIFRGTFIAGTTPQIEIEDYKGLFLNQFTRVVCCNTDYTDDTTKVFTSQELTLLPAGVERREMDSEITEVIKTDNSIIFKFAEPFIAGTNLVTGVTTQGIVAGKLQETALYSPSLINQDGYFALVLWHDPIPGQNVPAYTNGAWLSISQISCLSEGLEIYAENLMLYPQETNPIRTYTTPPTVKILSSGSQGIAFQFDETTGAIVSSGTSGTSIDLLKGVMNSRDTYFSGNVEGLDFALIDSIDEPVAYPTGSKITLQNQMSVTINGVQYNLPLTIEGFTGVGHVNIQNEVPAGTIQAGTTQITITLTPNQTAVLPPAMQANLDPSLTEVTLRDESGGTGLAKQINTLAYALNENGTAMFTLTGVFDETQAGLSGTPESVYLVIDEDLSLEFIDYMYVDFKMEV